MKPIAHIKNDLSTKFGIPRQSGLVESLESCIVFEPEFRQAEALRGLDGFSHLWLLWDFSENHRTDWSPTVRPPRLGGNKRMGVFATRSPFRPNRLGLSSLRIKRIDFTAPEAPVIYVAGADLMNGTPIFDIKPYVESDLHPDAVFGFTKTPFPTLEVEIPEPLAAKMGKKSPALIKVLENRPIPAYQNDSERVYGMRFADKEIHFQICENTLTVTDIR